MVAHQRHSATLARASHHMLGVRASAGHVPQRPQLLHATRLGRANHGVERLRVRVRVAEHRYDHHPNPRPRRASPAESQGKDDPAGRRNRSDLATVAVRCKFASWGAPVLRATCEDTRNAVRARVPLCPTACPTGPEFPMPKPNQAGIIIRRSGVRVPPPAPRLGPAAAGPPALQSTAASRPKREPGPGGAAAVRAAPGDEFAVGVRSQGHDQL
jgi:hypothetical protein